MGAKVVKGQSTTGGGLTAAHSGNGSGSLLPSGCTYRAGSPRCRHNFLQLQPSWLRAVGRRSFLAKC